MRRPAPVSVVVPQRCLAAEPTQLKFYPDDARAPAHWTHPGALPSFTFKAFQVGRRQPPPDTHVLPGMSVTSQFVKISKEDGKFLFFPVRHIRRGKPTPTQPQSGMSGSAKRSGLENGGGLRSSATPRQSVGSRLCSTSPRSTKKHFSMENLAVSLERRNTICVPESSHLDVKNPEPVSPHKSWSASALTRPGTIRQSMSFGRQISVRSLQGTGF